MSAARALWIGLVVLVVARGLLAFVPSMWGWGLDAQRFLDPFFGAGLWVVAALASIPRVARGLTPAIAGLGDFLAHARRPSLIAFVAGATVVACLPDRTWFIGDFMIRQGNVESGFFAANYMGALPLDPLLHSVLLRPFGAGSVESANLMGRLLGAFEAGLLAALAVAFARALALGGALLALAAGVVFFGGYLTVFTGLGKPASEMCLAVVALAAFGIRAIRDRSSLLPCSLVMALALGLHRSSVLLLPTWVLVVATWWRAAPAEQRRHGSTLMTIGLPLVVAAFAIPRIVQIAFGYDLSHHVLTPEARQAGGPLAAAFSARHLVDLANLILALSPLAILIPALLPLGDRDRPPRPEAPVLMLLSASFVPALLLIEPQQGVFRDWDVFAAAGVAFSLVVAWLIADRLAVVPARAWLAVSALALVTVSSLQWLALNHEPERGLARVRAFLVEPPGPEPVDRPLVWDFLAERYMRLRQWSAASDAAAHAAVDAPHRRILLMWALAATMAEDYPTAERVYRRLLERVPDDPLGWLGLAGIAFRVNDRAELDRALARLRSYAPNGPEMRIIRRHLTFYPQVWPTAAIEDWSPYAAP